MARHNKSTSQRRRDRRAKRGGIPAGPHIVPVPCRFTHVYSSGTLASFGPLVFASWGLHPIAETALRSAGKPVPAAVSGVILLDTGATYTSIALKAASALGLTPIRFAPGFGSGGQTNNPVFKVVLAIKITDERGNSTTLGFPLEAQGIPELQEASETMPIEFAGKRFPMVGLLGRDILRFTRFEYDGLVGRLSLEFDLKAMGMPTHHEVPRAPKVAVEELDSDDVEESDS